MLDPFARPTKPEAAHHSLWRSLVPQRLVYLDTSNIIHLTDARAREPHVYADAVKAWRAADVTLALSRVHLVELRAHDVAETRAERVRVIQDLVPVRTDIDVHPHIRTRPLSMSEREILATVIRDNVLSLPTEEIAAMSLRLPVRAMEAFPLQWSDAPAVNALRSYDGDTFGSFAKLVRVSVDSAVEAVARPANAPYEQLRLRDLSDTPLPQAERTAMEQRFTQTLAAIESLPPIVSKLPDGVQRQMLHQEVEALRSFQRRVAEAGLRRAFAEQYGVEDVAKESRTLDEIVRAWSFRRMVQQVLHEVLGIELSRAVDLAGRMPVGACPGIWLYQAVDHEIQKGEPATTASSAYDLDHLVYFPHVDEFFADKRTRRHVEAVLRRIDCPAALRGRRLPRFVPRSVSALAQEVSVL